MAFCACCWRSPFGAFVLRYPPYGLRILLTCVARYGGALLFLHSRLPHGFLTIISGKIVTLPGDADFPNTNTRPTNSTLYPGDSAGAGAAGMQGQAPHPVFDQCSCTQCRESRSTSTSRTAGGDGGGGAAATAASSAMRQARENTSTMTLVDLPEPLLVLICKDLGYV